MSWVRTFQVVTASYARSRSCELRRMRSTSSTRSRAGASAVPYCASRTASSSPNSGVSGPGRDRHDAAAQLRLEGHPDHTGRVRRVLGNRPLTGVAGHLGDELPSRRPVDAIHREHLTVLGRDHRAVAADQAGRPLNRSIREPLAVRGIQDEIGEAFAEAPLLAQAPEAPQPARRLEPHVEERERRERRECDGDLRVRLAEDKIGADREHERHEHRGKRERDRPKPRALDARHRPTHVPEAEGRLDDAPQPYHQDEERHQALRRRLRTLERDPGDTDDDHSDEHRTADDRSEPDGQLRHRCAEREERHPGGEEERDREVTRPDCLVARQQGCCHGDAGAAEQRDGQREQCACSITLTQPPFTGECAQKDAGAPQNPRQHNGRSAQGTASIDPGYANSPDFTVL